MRLVRGVQENGGQVEFCSSGRWSLVCRDYWDINDATVACRQLGYNVEGTVYSSKIVNIKLTAIVMFVLQLEMYKSQQ